MIYRSSKIYKLVLCYNSKINYTGCPKINETHYFDYDLLLKQNTLKILTFSVSSYNNK